MIANNQNIIYNDIIKIKREFLGSFWMEDKQNGSIYNENDTLDINELAALNDDISPEFIEQLQNQVSQTANMFNGTQTSDDSKLFEEVTPVENTQEEVAQQPDAQEFQEEKAPEPPTRPKDTSEVKANIEENFDDNFIKKYKAKLNKQQNGNQVKEEDSGLKELAKKEAEIKNVEEKNEIENLSSGNIIEKPATQEQVNYNDSLDFLDDNVKYSKYVIYIDPENTDFIDSLTVKERKNLINRILREQDDITITKRRLGMIQTIIKHAIIAIITIAIAVPVVYFTINASLEATINNYRQSQTIFKTLYREKGKIKNNI